MIRKSVITFNDVAIDTFEENDCRIHFWFLTKSEAVDRMKNADLSENSGQI